MTQAAGAVLSGGIFGGPEGFLGGAIGALGGVGGAFAGAAIGAQVGGIRRTLGEYADYAAQIARLQIALEGISGSQAQYNRALAAAADVTSSLNVPQEVAIQGMTRLTAAVKGAGGGVADAELAFKNINSAIIATGGGAEQVQGAVTALVQIFSKGKVSAEEINQIAERLPGTFNKIAAASGRTGPELTKALQDGKVGLNDLMKFLVSLGDEYGELAEKIAASSENAGARLQIAFNDMRIEVGDALQPIGAEFQDAFTEFIEDITPTLVAVLPKVGEAALLLAQNIDQVVVAALSLGSAFAVIKFAAIISSLGGVAATAKLAAAGLASMDLAGMVNPAYLFAAGIAAVGVSLYNTWKEQEEFNRTLREAPLDTVNQKIDELRQEINDLNVDSQSAVVGMSMFGGSMGFASVQAAQLKADLEELIARQRELAAYQQAGVNVRPGYYGPGFAAPLDSETRTIFDEPKTDTSTRGKGRGSKTLVDDTERRLKAAQSAVRAALDEQAVLEATGTIEKIRVQGAVDLMRISAKYAESAEEAKSAAEIDFLVKAQALEVSNRQLRTLNQLDTTYGSIADSLTSVFAEGKAIDEELIKANKEADIFKQTMEGVGEILGTTMVDAIGGLIDGTAQLNDILSDVSKQVGSLLLNAGLNALAGPVGSGGILSFLGFGTRANGGPVNANEPYIIGERGPELFIPFQSGRVASNGETDAIMSSAFQRNGSVSLPFTRNSETLATVRDPGPIDVRYESQVINGVEYVTAEQHRKGMAQAAERGRALTLQTLQNSPRARAKVGI